VKIWNPEPDSLETDSPDLVVPCCSSFSGSKAETFGNSDSAMSEWGTTHTILQPEAILFIREGPHHFYSQPSFFLPYFFLMASKRHLQSMRRYPSSVAQCTESSIVRIKRNFHCREQISTRPESNHIRHWYHFQSKTLKLWLYESLSLYSALLSHF